MLMVEVTRPGPMSCDRAASDAGKIEASTVMKKHHALGDAKPDRASQHRSFRPGLAARRWMSRPSLALREKCIVSETRRSSLATVRSLRSSPRTTGS
jgi:hypothetical protein